MTQRILITTGEPAGVGPDIALLTAQKPSDAELVVVSNIDLLRERARQLNLKINLVECDLEKTPTPNLAQALKVISVPLAKKVDTGKPVIENAAHVIETLKLAADICLQKKAHAVVTGPVNKAVICDSGIDFKGHTEFFRDYCGVPLTVMLFVINNLRVALLTTHIPLAKVSPAITSAKLTSTLKLLHQNLQTYFAIEKPRILVCGVNPHAGENGHLGREEIDVIQPTIKNLAKDFLVHGPLPADTIFTPKHLKEADAILGMYHDQVLPLVKYIGFGDSVNVTLGLPFVRTSVDHGTAFDVAGTDQVDASSLMSAINLATKISQGQPLSNG